MRVLYLATSGQLGGAERVLLDMVRASAAAGWHAAVILPEDGPLAAAVTTAGGEPLALPMPGAFGRAGEAHRGAVAAALALAAGAWPLPRYVGRLRGAIRRLDAQVVHANGVKMHVLGAHATDRPLVWHLHDYVGSRRLSARVLRAHARRPAAIVANSEDVAADARSALNRADVVAVPNGVDLARFAPDGPRADLDAAAGLPARDDVVRVGLVATYARWKGHDTFLRALARVPAAVPVRGYVIGGPLYRSTPSQCTRAELEAMADALGIRDRVGFVPFTSDPAAVYRALDIVVHASTAPEPFGLVAAEAMACGRALVAADRGGVIAIAAPGAAARHRAGDAEDLADVIGALSSNPERRALLGAAARRHVTEHFSVDRFARVMTELHVRLAEPGAAPVSA